MANADNGSRDPGPTDDRSERHYTAAQNDRKLMDLARAVGTDNASTEPVATRYAATVICCRESDSEAGSGEPEVLMARRDTNLAFAGGMWVFPGGRIDDADVSEMDLDGGNAPDAATLGAAALDRAERCAAAREALEEVDIALEPGELLRYSHWTPPPQTKKRYLTSFFVAPLWDERARRDVTVDDSEIREHRWLSISDVLAAHSPGRFDLAPPTFITLSNLAGHRSLADLVRAVDTAEPERYATKFATIEGIGVAIYHGDCAYEHVDDVGIHEIEGPRHRLWMSPEGWNYERFV